MKNLTVFLLLALVSIGANAQMPHTFSYQGLVTQGSSGSTVIPDGKHSLTLSLYDKTNALVYSETQDAMFLGGLFNVIVGSVTPFPANFTFDKQYTLGTSVDDAAEFSPRT